ncbi:MAG: hypothetical protein CO127_11845 [Ignavibacteria bacterium CG_4_9_14_3_um_filter_36_18]|nr:HAD hydrolase-like protein [Ignavibacteria bacterium]PJA98876.1 MAG: hypothetical protein CO127_11845 [Ignavibacteria bacterium CG_4_9_14_3_um_filter_36_18]
MMFIFILRKTKYQHTSTSFYFIKINKNSVKKNKMYDILLKSNETLMVGDTELDIQCGKAAGAFTCAVSYGYRTIEQLKLEQPDLIVKNMKELITLLE